MKKLLITLLCCLVLAGCGSTNKSNKEITDIEQFKCQYSIQTVFDVLGKKEMETNTYIGECYTYENLNLYGYNGKAIFRVRDDKDTISSFECSLKLDKKEFEDVLSQLKDKYGECEKNEYTNQIAYVWEFPEEKSEEMGYNKVSLSDYGDKKAVVDFSDEWSMYKDEAYYKHLEEEKQEDRETVLNQEYKFDGGTVDMMLSKDKEEKYYFSIMITTDIKWKAAYAYTLYAKVTNTDEMNKLNPTVLAFCGDVMLTPMYSCKQNDDGDTEQIDSAKWLADAIQEAPSNKIGKFSDKLAGFIQDFVSK